MEIPRVFSSGRRSVSRPVSAATSAVFPWSTWPAVPSVSGAPLSPPSPTPPPRRSSCAGRAGAGPRARGRRRAGGGGGARGGSGGPPRLERDGGALQLEQRQRATADARGRADDLTAERRG